jgi:hypothetical protein
MSGRRKSGVMCIRGITRCGLSGTDTGQWFVHVQRTAPFLGKMAQQHIHRHAEGTNSRVQLHHNGCHLSPEHHMCGLMTVTELEAPKQKSCYPHICLYILCVLALHCAILIHMLRIACTIQMQFQIC